MHCILKMFSNKISNCLLLLVAFTICQSSGGENNVQEKLNHWKAHASKKIKEKAKGSNPGNWPIAKNVILFIGDGMGVTVTTAGRIYKSQKFPDLAYQEPFHFETYPFGGLVKTHSLNSHVTESAAAASALMCGAKFWSGHVSLLSTSADGQRGPFQAVECMASMAMKAGKSVGVVTTTRVTHGTPAPLYASTPGRYWEGYRDFTEKTQNVYGYKDIASQLLEDWPGNNLSIIFGGGLSKFRPNSIQSWLKSDPENRKFVQTSQELQQLTTTNGQFKQILGLFNDSNLSYTLDRKQQSAGGTEPTLAEMTEAAIRMLSQNQNGYFLLVEGGRIDHALHVNNAKRSFEDLLAFDDAIKAANDAVNQSETLIVVTADHSHNLNLLGYAEKNVSIFGFLSKNDSEKIEDGMPSTMLIFGDGPAGKDSLEKRKNWTLNQQDVKFEDKDFQQPAMIYRHDASHGGEDVAVYAQGPWSQLFTGLVENTDIFYFMCSAMALDHCKDLAPVLSPPAEKPGLLGSVDSTWLFTAVCFMCGGLLVSVSVNAFLICKRKKT